MHCATFSSSVEALCTAIPELNGKIFSVIDWKTKEGKRIGLRKLSLCLLNPKYTQSISYYLHSSLLELIGKCCSLAGKFNTSTFNLTVHTAFCITFSKLSNDDAVRKYAQNYFLEAPSPFYQATQELKPPKRKKQKLNNEIYAMTEIEVLEATYNLLLNLGTGISEKWETSDLLQYLKHRDEKIRWFACNCLALLVRMSEGEKNEFILKNVSPECHTQMIISRQPKHHLKSLKASAEDPLTSEYTKTFGCVTLFLHQKVEDQKEGLVPLASTKRNLEAIALGISAHQPVLIEGVVGSGKTSLVEYLGQITGRSKAPELSKIQLSDQTDSKTLIGTYRCTANPGEFIWQAGSLTQAVTGGHWLLLEDIDFAPMDVISLLVPLLEFRILPVPGHGNVKAHPNFQVFATRRILPSGYRIRIGSANLLEKLWSKVPLQPLAHSELNELICSKWPQLESIAAKLVEVYLVVSLGQHGNNESFEGCSQCTSSILTSTKTSGRLVSIRDMIKWCSRIVSHVQEEDLNVRAFQEALDCFCAAVPDSERRFSFALHIGVHLNVGEAAVVFYMHKYKPVISTQMDVFSVGPRGRLPCQKIRHISLLETVKSTFSKTRLSSCLLEKVTVAVMNNEPVLVVGETGTGKTSTIQFLAEQTKHSLRVINMNQQSDSTDLLGGFKPIDVRTVISPFKAEFENLFTKTFSAKQNVKFLTHIMTTFNNQQWNYFFSLVKHSIENAEKKLNTEIMSPNAKICENNPSGRKTKGKKSKRIEEVKDLLTNWENFHFKLKTVMDQVERVKSSFAFAFIEGTLVKAVQQGDWVLLDEINLATDDTLECLTGLLESSFGSLTLHERGDNKPVTRHENFRLFACMNPATDVGKKELPVGLRNRFTEIFVDEFQSREDLKQIVRDYLQEQNPLNRQISGIVDFYLEVRKLAGKKLVDGTGHKPHFSLRTLCRALMVARKNPCKKLSRSLYDAMCLSFLTQLCRPSYLKVIKLIESFVLVKGKNSSISWEELRRLKEKTRCTPVPCPGDPKDYVKVERFWVLKGDKIPESPETYILTKTVRQNLNDLVRIVSIGRFPVLLQGDTSVGKTSLISYLAKLTGNNCVRINNHQHTDLQEYVGAYAPDETGKLVFKEGVLVKAMRNGHWIILDELNLAPTDVLEALNRLLDDNRELFIPEIDTTVKAHERFMLFATQNPPGRYGGRQVLSRAFRNRFVELHFNLIPSEELQIILEGRCQIPPSLSRKMVAVLKDLQSKRRKSNIFEGKQSFVTLRDLFRWAERYRLAPVVSGFYDWDQHMVDEGYLVLAGKVRLKEETDAVKSVLKKYLAKEVKEENLFDLSEETSPATKHLLEKLGTVRGFEHVVWTRDLRRLFVLVSKALSFREPVLLVGETGCGKTTVCQMIAALLGQVLFAINCHMHTEGADFLGGLRPVRDRATRDEGRLFEWVEGPLIQAMKNGGMFLADEISLADDSVLERLNSILEPERTLVLSEKGIGDGEGAESLEVIVAHDLFRLVGTMNPGGDYGKKELSPALKNRFTEIWCPKVEIGRSSSDVELIIKHNIKGSVEPVRENVDVAKLMLFFLRCFTQTDLGKKLTVSIRDILSWVKFINQVSLQNTYPVNFGSSYVHGACIVFLDSLGSGCTGSTVLNWKKVKEASLQLLCWQAQQMSPNKIDVKSFGDVESPFFRNDSEMFGIEPFLIHKGNVKPAKPPVFSFRAPRTCSNLLRILRGLQLPRPILLEGSPGVGKTSLVISLAKASGNDIVRINLSEQTDVSDLFGADLPVEGGEGGHFAWHDGPLLQALKRGSWVVLDELNLASQSVLEGLNACFDHRGEIFVPELNKTFTIEHRSTKIFACQNPQYEGGARKGLPKSFLNRFTQVFIEPLSAADLEFILGTVHPEIPTDLVIRMIKFNDILVEEILERKLWGAKGGPWELNLRDMFRWCEIMLRNQVETDLNPGEFVEMIYSDRMRTEKDKREVLDIYKRLFPVDLFPLYEKAGTFFIYEKAVQAGRALLERRVDGNAFVGQKSTKFCFLHNQMPYLESLVNCINMNWMAILVGDSEEGKTSLVHLLAQLAGQRLETVAVNSQMDVTELLGGFEQADYGRRLSELTEELQKVVWARVRFDLLNSEHSREPAKYLSLWKELNEIRASKTKKTTSEEVAHFTRSCEATLRVIDCLKKEQLDNITLKRLKRWRKECLNLLDRVTKAGTISGGGTFEWVDSLLVKAVRHGYWLLLDGVNLCSPSVLDRLNGLLEPGGVLTIDERGIIKGSVPVVTPHPNFRLFLTMNPQHGEISRAMRNRGVEICVHGMWQNKMDIRALLLSQGLEDVEIQTLLIDTHLDICTTLSGFEKPSISCLSQAASLIKALLQMGKPKDEAVDLGLNLIYHRDSRKPTVRRTIERSIATSVKGLKKEMESSKISKPLLPVNDFLLSAKNLAQYSALGFVKQLVALTDSIHMFKKSNSKSTLMIHPLEKRVPTSEHSLMYAVFLCLISLPVGHWKVYKAVLVQSCGQHVRIVKALEEIIDDPFISLQLLENICDGELPADPRFNTVALKLKVCNIDLPYVTSLSNKALNGLWIKVQEAFSRKEAIPLERSKTSRRKKNVKSVLELSKDISEGHVGEERVYHPCLRQLASLLECISDLMLSLANCTDSSLTDDEYFKLREALLWKKRLEAFCNQAVSKNSFQLFFPILAFLWKNFQELLDSVPPAWEPLLPEKMPQLLQEMKQSFQDHFSPLHDMIPKLRSMLKPPLPYRTKESAAAFTKLYEIAENFTPHREIHNEKETEKILFLGSEKGLEVKTCLLNLAVDMTEESCDVTNIMGEVTDLEFVVFSALPETDFRSSTSLYAVHLWPFMDYFVSRLLSLTELRKIKADIPLHECQGTLAKASRIPIQLIRKPGWSRSEGAVVLYLFNTSNCSVLWPSYWLNFNCSEETEGDSELQICWEGENSFVLSPMGCLLTYMSLVGFCTPDQVGDISVGNYSERVAHLTEIRKMLIQNWELLSKPENSYSFCYKESVRDFTSRIITSLFRALDVDIPRHKIIACIEDGILQHKELLGSEGTTLLQEISYIVRSIESSGEEIVQVAKLGILSGLLQSWLLSHTEPLDPVQEEILLMTYYKDELEDTKHSQLLHEWITILRYCQTSEPLHPHFTYYENRITELGSEVERLAEKVAYRPDPSQYDELVQDMSHFVSTVFLPSRISELQRMLTSQPKRVWTVLQQCEATLRSCDNFIHKMVKTYALYNDLVTPFLHGVVIVCESLRLLMVMARNKELSLCIQRMGTLEQLTGLDETLSRLLYFPALRGIHEPETILAQTMSCQKTITGLLRENDSKSSCIYLSQSLSHRASLYDLYNSIIVSNSFNEKSFHLLKDLIEEVILWWREQEDEKRKKKEEEEALFQYKSRPLVISETEEEEIDREYEELFPDYSEEFKDLENDTSELEDTEREVTNASVETEDDDKLLKLPDEYLEEVIEVHKLLMFGLVDTPWMSSKKNTDPKTLTPVVLRTHQVKLLMRSVGPFATHEVDETSMAALILSNRVACSVGKKSMQLSVVDKPFNFYHDSDLEETLKVRPLLEALERKVDNLLHSWPSHPSLSMIKKVISRVLSFTVSSPLIRLVIGLEMVLEKSQEWEKNSHKGVSLMAELTPIIDQVIRWRKMELKAWKCCLEMIAHKISADANKFWLHLYASVVSFPGEDADSVIEALKQFMESSSVGCFKRRLEILRAIHSHLSLEIKYCVDECRKKTLSVLVAVTWNSYKYYSQFQQQAREALKNGQKPIQEQVKNFIKITRWNDINFFAMKDSVIKSRRTLHRHMRNWEKALRQPFTSLLTDDNSDISGNSGKWDSDKTSVLPQVVFKSYNVEVEFVKGAKEESLIGRLPSLVRKSSHLIKKTLSEMSYEENTEAVEEMVVDIITTYQDLVLATTRAENIDEKEDRLRHMKDVMNRKKRSFAILFKTLHHYGVSFTKGNNLWQDNCLDKCLVVPPLNIKIALKTMEGCEDLRHTWDSCDRYYYKSIARHALLMKSLHQAHKDLSPDDVKRLKGSAAHLMLFSQRLRQIMPEVTVATSEIDAMVNEIDKASQGFVPVTEEFASWWNRVHSSVVSLSLTLAEEIKLLEAFPDCDSLLDMHPQPHSLTELKVTNVVQELKKINTDVSDTIKSSLATNKTVAGGTIPNLASFINIGRLEALVSDVCSLSTRVALSIKELSEDSEATTSLTKSLIAWTDGWDNLNLGFEAWKSRLTPVNVDFYNSSDKVENCVRKILKAIEELYKRYCEGRNQKVENGNTDEATKFMISEGIIFSLISDYEHLNACKVKEAVFSLFSDLKNSDNTTLLIALRSMKPLLIQYVLVCKSMLAYQIRSFRALGKLQSVLLGIFQQIAIKGFCRPQELQEKRKDEEGTQFLDSGMGLCEGEGQKDVSERFESEDQIESALQEGETEAEGNKDVREDNGIEMSQDFQGKLQDMQRDEEKGEGDDSESEEEEEEHDKQMGETEKGAEKLDEKLWGDEEEEEDEKESEGGGGKKEEEEEHGPGDGETTQSELVAKDDNKNKKKKDKEEPPKRKELEVMEEDRREPAEEQGEATYDDNYIDKFGGEDHPNENDEEEQMELPDDMMLDGGEGDENDENVDGMNPEIEEQPLFPEEEREPKEKKEQAENEEEEEAETNAENKEGEEKEEEGKGDEQDGDDKEQRQQRMVEEEGDQEKDGENEEDKAIPSMDKSAPQEAEAADMETVPASKDKTKDDPNTATGAQPEEDEELKQEEQGLMGEQTEDVSGVGQSDSKTKEEAHRGKTSALTNEEEAREKMEEQNKPRKPGDLDQIKSLGEIEKEIHQGLLTKERSGAREEKEEKDNEEEKEEQANEELRNRDANLYEHIGKAEDHCDKQTIDAATEEQAKLRPAPLEEEEEEGNEDLEGIVDTLMEEEKRNQKEEITEEIKKREAETEGDEGPNVKKLKEEMDPLTECEVQEHRTEIEGDVVMEMVVQRPITNEIFTQLDQEEVAAAIFGEDLALTREKVEEVGEGDSKMGAECWTELEGRVFPFALQLCEQLRLILEPTQASKLKGDFRTGKRLNMRKVIPYIASQFRKDKIWLRRTQPNKRTYQVLLAVDDSESMNQAKAVNLARASVALVAKALTMLEVGQVGMVSFGEQTRLLHPFHLPFSDKNGAKAFANLTFAQTKTNFSRMLEDAVALLAGAARTAQSSSQSEITQLLLILSDGQTYAHSQEVREAVRTAQEAGVFMVFLVLDAHDNKYSFYDAYIFQYGKLMSIIDTFPFPFYLVVRDFEGLPDAIAEALRQWFGLVTADNR